MEALTSIKSKYKQTNERLSPQRPEHVENLISVMRPLICYYTQFDTDVMQQFITQDEQADCNLNKPLPHKELVSLLKLICVL